MRYINARRPFFDCKISNFVFCHSFDLFYGLFKFNRNSMDIVNKLKDAMDDVVGKLLEKEGKNADADLKRSCL